MQDKQAVAIAKLVKERRVERNLTQQQLADLTGLSLRSVQRVEKAEVTSRAYTLEVVGKQLQLDEAFREVMAEAVTNTPDYAPLVNRIPVKRLTRAQKIIFSISAALLIMLLITAYIFQSVTFPETGFELLVLLMCALLVYTAVLYFVWR